VTVPCDGSDENESSAATCPMLRGLFGSSLVIPHCYYYTLLSNLTLVWLVNYPRQAARSAQFRHTSQDHVHFSAPRALNVFLLMISEHVQSDSEQPRKPTSLSLLTAVAVAPAPVVESVHRVWSLNPNP